MAGTPDQDRPAWVTIPSEEALRRALPFAPYDFGFLPAMTRLVMAHDRIGPFFGLLFGQIMFAPGKLTRGEREMVAAITAAAQDCHY